MKKNLACILVSMISLYSSIVIPAPSGHEGNGGDAVEAFFIQKGSSLLAKLSRTPRGQMFLNDLPVSLVELTATLDFQRISVYNDRLHDVTGAEVDALVEEGVIYLTRDIWLDHIKSNHDIDMLVFHEMLRSAGVKDDNYIFSKNVALFGDLLDPKLAMSLSRYINPSEIRLNAVDGSSILSIDTFTYINNPEMKLEITGTSLYQRNSVSVHQDKTYVLNIPVYNTEETKVVIYRIDYEYVGFMAPDTVLHTDQDIKGNFEKTYTVIDLLNLPSIYKENLQIRVSNSLEARAGDRLSYMTLNRVIVYFNILRLTKEN
jgi:hypothetical protein